jgi:peptide/nickel transport system permease protein
LDSAARLLGVLGMATPSFWLGIVLILVFAVRLQVLPAAGVGGPKHYVLPAFTLGWALSAGIMRLLRSSMLEILDADYVKFARIKGVPERAVVWKHAMRNALIPVVTFGGYYVALLIGAAVVTETVFAWPGVARLAYEAVLWRDFPVIQGVVLMIATLVLIVNLIVDILYAYLDPRIRY